MDYSFYEVTMENLKLENFADKRIVVGQLEVLGDIGGSSMRTLKTTVNANQLKLATITQNQEQFWKDMANDSVITPPEKKSLKMEWNTLDQTYTAICELAEELSITPFIYSLTVRYEDLRHYLFDELKLFDVMSEDTDIPSREIFEEKFNAYYREQTNAQNLVTTYQAKGEVLEVIEEQGVALSTVTYHMEVSDVSLQKDNSGYKPSTIQIQTFRHITKETATTEETREIIDGTVKVYAVYSDNTETEVDSGETEDGVYSFNTILLERSRAINTVKLCKIVFGVIRDGQFCAVDVQKLPIVTETSGLQIILTNESSSYNCTEEGVISEQLAVYTEVKMFKNTEESFDFEIDGAFLENIPAGFEVSFTDTSKRRLKIVNKTGTEMAWNGVIEIPVIVYSAVDNLFVIGDYTENSFFGIGYPDYQETDADGNIVVYDLVIGDKQFNENSLKRDVFFTYYKHEVHDKHYLGVRNELPENPKNNDWFTAGVDIEYGEVLMVQGHLYQYDEAENTWKELDPSNTNKAVEILTAIPDLALKQKDDDGYLNQIFVKELFAMKAVIKELQSKVISLERGGLLKSSNFDGRIIEDEAGNRKLDFDSPATQGFAFDTYGNGRLAGITEIADNAIIRGTVSTKNLIVENVTPGDIDFNHINLIIPGRTQGQGIAFYSVMIIFSGVIKLKIDTNLGDIWVTLDVIEEFFNEDFKSYQTRVRERRYFNDQSARESTLTVKAGDKLMLSKYSGGSATWKSIDIQLCSNVVKDTMVWSLMNTATKESMELY